MRKISVVAFVGMLLVQSVAQAVPVTYDFTANGGPDGPLANVSSSGFFTYDDAIMPSGGGIVIQTGLILDLAFSWNGVTYDETTANTGGFGFEPSGELFGWTFGTNCSTTTCLVTPGTNSWAIANTAKFGGVFVYTLAGSSEDFAVPFAVTITRRPATSVAEPGTLALALCGLLAAGLLRRRRAERR